MRIPSLGATLLSLALPFAPLAAQDHARADHAPAAHGRLGLMLDGESDSAGARVRGVVPESPAATAGLLRGDVITGFNGTALGGADKLVELARGLAPGDSVRLEYRRGGETKTAILVADRMKPRLDVAFRRMRGAGDMPGMSRFGFHMGDMTSGMAMMFHHHGVAGLCLVPVGKDLGEYFGTSEGFLIVRPPADSASPLKAGDVLLAIDGRKLQSVQHTLGILHSYAPGEKAKLEVMRKKQRTTLTWTAPARHHPQAWGDAGERSEGPEPADLFEMELPALDQALGLGET
jgi:S1-C subfamily serine protease